MLLDGIANARDKFVISIMAGFKLAVERLDEWLTAVLRGVSWRSVSV